MLFACPVSFGNPMIVLKCTQDKLLSVLQSVSGIVERRHALPLFQNVLVRGLASATPNFVSLLRSLTSAPRTPKKFHLQVANQTEPLNQNMGFFSAQKLNMRNAP
jgi:hypothetical protein